MYDIAELLLAVATQNNIMRTENRTWLWFESQYAGNVEALVAGSPSLHAGVRAECWSTEYGRQLLAADWLLVVDCEVRVMLKVLGGWCWRSQGRVEWIWLDGRGGGGEDSLFQQSSWLCRTQRATFFRNPSRLLRHSFCKHQATWLSAPPFTRNRLGECMGSGHALQRRCWPEIHRWGLRAWRWRSSWSSWRCGWAASALPVARNPTCPRRGRAVWICRHRRTCCRLKWTNFSFKLCSGFLLRKCKVFSLFGCQMLETNLRVGGLTGYSLGNVKCALKKPPSLKE